MTEQELAVVDAARGLKDPSLDTEKVYAQIDEAVEAVQDTRDEADIFGRLKLAKVCRETTMRNIVETAIDSCGAWNTPQTQAIYRERLMDYLCRLENDEGYLEELTE